MGAYEIMKDLRWLGYITGGFGTVAQIIVNNKFIYFFLLQDCDVCWSISYMYSCIRS
jgi:hypothetical protein